jgi:hypothetical protein
MAWRYSQVKATELIEDLERQVAEFGDGDVRIPDLVERWTYSVTRVEFESADQTFRVVSDH